MPNSIACCWVMQRCLYVLEKSTYQSPEVAQNHTHIVYGQIVEHARDARVEKVPTVWPSADFSIAFDKGNSRANMNPQQAAYGTNLFFASWKNQKCRPTFGVAAAIAYNGGVGSAGGRARGGTNPSECFYCVEPCRNVNVKNGGTLRPGASEAEQTAALSGSLCVGRSDENPLLTNSFAFLVRSAMPIIDTKDDIFNT